MNTLATRLTFAVAAAWMGWTGCAQAQTRVIAPTSAAPAVPGAGMTGPAGGAGTAAQQARPLGAAGGAGVAAPLPMPSLASPRPDLVNESVEQIAPLTREELVRLRRELDERSKGMTENVTGRPAPRPSAQVFQLELSPSAAVAPPVVRVTPGQGAVISFLDSTGAPWPIELADNAAADGGIVVQKFTNHQLSVFARTRTALGNVLVALKNLPTAVSFTVVSGQEATDYQVHLVVPRFLNGPPTNVLSSSSVPALGTGDLFDYLLRTPPQGAKPLKVEGMPGAAAWQTGPTKMVVRTDAQLTEALRHFSLDGTGVYEVRLSPLVLGTFNGRFVEIKVSGF